MPEPDPSREFRLRLLLAISTSILISTTAYICAWLEVQRGHEPTLDTKNVDPTDLWDFTFEMPTTGIKLICLLAGVVAFPICYLTGFGYRGTKATLIFVLAANFTTVVCAVLAASVMVVMHYLSGH